MARLCYKGNMPKIIDATQRRSEVADAVFAIVVREGFSAVSLRSIAEETGLAIGSIRHYFSTADEIVRFALDTIVERISARLEARLATLLPDLDSGRLSADEARSRTVDFLAELLPLDEVRRHESVVWLAFEEEARTRPELADVFNTSVAGTTHLMRRVFANMSSRGTIDPNRSLDMEADILAALLDGLTLRSTLHPEVLSPRRAQQVLENHLRRLQAG